MKVLDYYRPTSLADAYETLMRNPQNQIMGGGAWLKLSPGEITTLITLDGLGLEAIAEQPEAVLIGAKATLRAIETSPLIAQLQGGLLRDAARHVMGVSLRNIATIGGSIVGRFSFSDILTALLAMNAQLVFHARGEIALADYLLLHRPEKDILLWIKIEKDNAHSAFRKVARTRLDFAILNLAIVKTRATTTIALGSRPQGPVLAKRAMAYLNESANLTEKVFEQAARLVTEELAFGDNLKAGKEYRRHLAYVLSKRLLKAVNSDES